MSKYDSSSIEERWQKMWKDEKVYHFDPQSDDPIFSIDTPPRYASGSMHLGHATGYSISDFAARYKRMKGFNVFFPLCFDVNGTPIEVRVEKKHNITKLDLPRSEYRKLCSDYANGFITEMKRDFERLGESMDPSIYYQTDAEYYRKITQLSFVELFDRKLVYKANYPVNWCPRCMTALADAEVDYKDNVTDLNFIKFGIVGTEDSVLIATTRPELLCTCQVVAVHPDDKAKQHLVGKELSTPLFNKKVKVISDEKVVPEFGTGFVMICTIGDKDDLEWVMKYRLPMEKGIDETGNMTELAGKYAGMSVVEARAASIKDLEALGLLEKQIDNFQQLSICWRCKTPIEYLQVPQWFLKTLDFREKILKRADEIKWYPEFMKVRLKDWVNSLQWDWVISRQRIFATPIPIWECEECDHAICATKEMLYCDPTEDKPPMNECPKCGGKLIGSTDVFDTWMDSSGSALYNTFWHRDDELHKKMFPMSLRSQSHDIIRTWAFYTMLRSEQIVEGIPWNDVMINGFIMAPDGTPMHSSVGNVIDPVPILENYGADALRYYAATCSLGIDHAFREPDVVRGGKFCNKIFNLGQFVSRFITSKPTEEYGSLRVSDKWILSRYSKTVKDVTAFFEVYQFDKALKSIESFIWHEFADHYVEMTKGREDDAVKYTLYTVFYGSLKMISPILPHVTEELYQTIFKQFENVKSIHVATWPETVLLDEEAENAGEVLKDVVAAIRSWKSLKKIPLNAKISTLELVGPKASILESARCDISETTKAEEIIIAKSAELIEEVVGVKPIHSKLGPAFKAGAKTIVAAISKMDPAVIAEQLKNGKVTIEGDETYELGSEYFEFETRLTLGGKAVETIQVGGILIVLGV
ncbi:MAG TPA: valine--tRNA ligase [Candidatus Methanomethylophilaceae archaeon]|nr:valine--tRNA ligase [Candidatus Methanomethylophilaceae archaeon]